MGILYVVATPIGNLADITLRAIRVLRDVHLIAAEDTRRTHRLLVEHCIDTPVTSYHKYNKRTKLKYLLGCLDSSDIALVSDAGMPGLSDPGYELISSAVTKGNKVVPVPGPSAVMTAVVVSCLPFKQFIYVGFLPRRKGERLRMLSGLARETRILVIFESPYRLMSSLRDIKDIMGNRRIAVCREMTKWYEEVFRGTVAEAMQHFDKPKGEITLVVEGIQDSGKQPIDVNAAATQQVEQLHSQGMRLKDAAKEVASITGISKRNLYQACSKITENNAES
ncbi:16S rRNA (cytidine(1402)-2'-O)-methyltransferase [Chloroflexota bacterium]